MKIKINSRYLVSRFKFNANCKDEEKIGEGPGSCGGSSDSITSSLDMRQMKDGRYFVALRTDKNLGKTTKDINGKNVYSGFFKRRSEAEQFKEKLFQMDNDAKEVITPTRKTESVNPVSSESKPTQLAPKTSDIRVIEGKYFSFIKSGNVVVKFKNADSKSKNVATKIAKEIDNLPSKLKSKITSITVLSVKHKTDTEDSFVTGQVDRENKPGNIALYNVSSSSKAMESIFHEAAHLLDGNGTISSNHEYADAVKSDGFISWYSKDTDKNLGRYRALKEDFADSVKMYIKDPEKLKKNSIKKYNIIKKHLED